MFNEKMMDQKCYDPDEGKRLWKESARVWKEIDPETDRNLPSTDQGAFRKALYR